MYRVSPTVSVPPIAFRLNFDAALGPGPLYVLVVVPTRELTMSVAKL